MRRLFGLLRKADPVFASKPVTVMGLRNLRRLTDLDAAPARRRRRPMAMDDLAAEYRAHLGLPGDPEVTPANLHELVAFMGAAKAARRQAGGGAVRREHLHAAAEPRRAARSAAAEIREYLSDPRIDLGVQRQRWLLGQLISPAAGGLELPEVLVALDAINEADLRDLFNDGGRLWASLDMAFVGTGPLLRQYHDLLGRRFTGGRKALAAGRVEPARMLRPALIGPVPGVPELARLSLAQLLTPRQVAKIGAAIADRADDRIVAAVNRAGRPLSRPEEAELRSWLAGVRTRAADGVAADESWQHHEERGAWWFEPAGLPVSQRALDQARRDAPFRRVMTGAASYDERRLEVSPGRRVRELTVRLHLAADGGPAAGLAGLRQQAAQAVRELLNRGYRLPGGDELHVRLEFADPQAGTAPHRMVTAGPAGSRTQPGRWAADATLADLAREIRRFLGVPEERRAEPRPADPFDLLPRHAWQIARAADGGQR
jgi:hypothetical protein